MRKLRSPFEEMDVEELEIWRKMLGYDEEYFLDMKFGKPEIRREFGRIEVKEKMGTSKEYIEDSPLSTEASCYTAKWIIRLVDKTKDEMMAQCVKENKEIKITKGLDKNRLKFTLLHELIHVYEALYEEFKYCEIYKQWLCIYLYESIKKRIGEKLIKKILEYELNYFIFRESRYRSFHSLLFLFKSLDLDLYLGKRFGTVYGYGREELFKEINQSYKIAKR